MTHQAIEILREIGQGAASVRPREAWLYEHMGKGGYDGDPWYRTTRSPNSLAIGFIYDVYHIADPNIALMFKLAWGGK